MAKSVTAVDAAQIAIVEGIASLWWWRAVSESLVRAGRMPRAQLAGILRDGEARCHQLEIPFADGDFTAFRKPYSRLSSDEHGATSAIAEARVRAFRWMLDDRVA